MRKEPFPTDNCFGDGWHQNVEEDVGGQKFKPCRWSKRRKQRPAIPLTWSFHIEVQTLDWYSQHSLHNWNQIPSRTRMSAFLFRAPQVFVGKPVAWRSSYSCARGHVCKAVRCSTVYTSEKLETTWMSPVSLRKSHTAYSSWNERTGININKSQNHNEEQI